ncbi:MAG: response regulator [Verrucomicrobiae bacterium]|nr:response regulator [Verrucomicrobiae bacterium]
MADDLSQRRSQQSRRLRILIVEDDRIVASDLRATLERLGHTVSGPANTGEAALVLAEKRAPDLALVDIRLGGAVDGISLAVSLRRKFGTPVVFLTGYSADAVFARAREAGPAGYLRKPFSDGELAASIAAALEQDGTRREHLRRAEAMRHVIAGLEEGVILSELDGRVTLMNAAAESLTGWGASEAIGRSLRDVAPLSGEEISLNAGNGDQPTPPTAPVYRSARLRTRTGASISVKERSTPIRSESGEPVGLVSVFRRADAPQKVVAAPAPPAPEMEEPPARGLALARAAELSRKPAFRELLGPRASAAGESPAFAPLFFDEVGDEDDAEIGGEIGDGRVSPLDEIGDPLLTLEAHGRITYANAEALVYFGGTSPLIGRDFWASFAPEAKERYHAEFQRAMLEGRRHHFEFHDTERSRWLDVSLYRSGTAGDGGLLALFRDITARKSAEVENVRLQRLEGLGLLARGFAHDFNNLLTVLIGSLDLAAERYSDDPEFREEMGNATHAAGDARDLVQQLLTFAQGGRPILEETRLADPLRQLLSERRHDHPGIRYQFQSSDPEIVASVDRRQIARLLENLITNSEQAMPDGGVLIARCHRITGEEASRLRNAPAAAEDDHVVIEVIDTGRGMSEEELDHAFEPYYTTRGGVNASGIGLTVCESIAKAHDGFIVLQSKEGRGTIATLCLPMHERAAWPSELPSNVFMPRQVEAAPASISLPEISNENAAQGHVEVSLIPPSSEVGHGTNDHGPESVEETISGRILILEDDSLIRRLIAVTLRRDGHEVVETADGHDTVRLYREAMESGQVFDLVLSDLTIEHGLGGVETMRAIQQMDPNVLAIVSSGYSDAPAMARPDAFGFSAVLPKPYPPRELRNLVSEMLQRRRSRGDQAVFPS